MLQFGTGGLNIHACRIGTELMSTKCTNKADKVTPLKKVRGRFPANVLHDGLQAHWASYFYCSKPSTAERDLGLEAFKLQSAQTRANCKQGTNTKFKGASASARNAHPTVKPIKLMEHLITLVTPEGGTVLDPLVGSGTTLIAARNLGLSAIGIDQDPEYVEIAKARLAA